MFQAPHSSRPTVVLVTAVMLLLGALVTPAAAEPAPSWDTKPRTPATIVSGARPAPSSANHPPIGMPPRRHSAWLPFWTMAKSYQAVIDNHDVIGTASPFWYYNSDCTTISRYSGAGDQAIIDGLHYAGIQVIPTVVTDLGAAAFVACNSDPAVRAQHVAALVAVATSRNYDGLDFDYENFIFPAGDAEGLAVRSVFTALVGETCAALHQVGRVCSVTVMAKTNGAAFRGAGVYDYPALGAVADRFRVMTYDEHIGTDPPGPIAGYPWVNAVAAYIHSTVPADKVELGIPFYGRDWGGERTVTVTGPQAYALAARYGAPIAYDPVQRAPYFGYSDGTNWHTVWFTNAQMVSDRIALAASYGFTKTTYWAAGQEAPEVWTAIRAAG